MAKLKSFSPLKFINSIRHSKGYGVHSPFLFSFIKDVIYQQHPYERYSIIESKLNSKEIFLTENERKYCTFLFRLNNFFSPKQILFIGDVTIAQILFSVEFCSTSDATISNNKLLSESSKDFEILKDLKETIKISDHPNIADHQMIIVDLSTCGDYEYIVNFLNEFSKKSYVCICFLNIDKNRESWINISARAKKGTILELNKIGIIFVGEKYPNLNVNIFF